MRELRLRNLLVSDGTLLAQGLPGRELGPEEWLTHYRRLYEEELLGPQEKILSERAAAILKRNPRLAAESAAV